MRTTFIVGLIVGFIYLTVETKESFTELRVNRIAQIEAALQE